MRYYCHGNELMLTTYVNTLHLSLTLIVEAHGVERSAMGRDPPVTQRCMPVLCTTQAVQLWWSALPLGTPESIAVH